MPERMSRQQRQQETRTRLLDAAERMFAERGIHGASLDDVAADAGLTKGAVYSNFTSKADLLLGLMQRRQAEDVVDAEGILADTSRPAEGRFHSLGKAYAHGVGKARSRQYAMLLLEFWLYGMRDPTAQTQAAEMLRSSRAGTRAAIETHHHNHTSRLSPTQLATLTTALDIGLAVQHLIDPEEVPGELYGTAMQLISGAGTGPLK